jgi:hypothetical protein
MQTDRSAVGSGSLVVTHGIYFTPAIESSIRKLRFFVEKLIELKPDPMLVSRTELLFPARLALPH